MSTLKRRGFTLIELLTVVAIIGLLIGILVPTVQRAQRKAKEVAIKAQLDGISKGLQMFNTDFGYFPASNVEDAQASGDQLIQGSHRMVFALLGRDQMGCPKEDPDNLSAKYYTTDGTFKTNDVGIANWGRTGANIVKTPRKGPYINPDGFYVADDNNHTGDNYTWLLCDKFDKKNNQPITAYEGRNVILYYRAAENKDLATDIYNARDNWNITKNNTDSSKSVDNDTAHVDNFLWGKSGNKNTHTSVGGIVNDKAIIGQIYPPYNKDTYLLISPGYDSEYFNEDDIVNWERK